MTDERLRRLRVRYLEIDSQLERRLAELKAERLAAFGEAQIQKDLAWSQLRHEDLDASLA